MKEFGELLSIEKGKYFAGLSKIQNGKKALYRVKYTAYFYNSSQQEIGLIGSDNPFTYIKETHTKSEMVKFLKESGYDNFTVD